MHQNTELNLPEVGYGKQSISSFTAIGTPSNTDKGSPVPQIINWDIQQRTNESKSPLRYVKIESYEWLNNIA